MPSLLWLAALNFVALAGGAFVVGLFVKIAINFFTMGFNLL